MNSAQDLDSDSDDDDYIPPTSPNPQPTAQASSSASGSRVRTGGIFLDPDDDDDDGEDGGDGEDSEDAQFEPADDLVREEIALLEDAVEGAQPAYGHAGAASSKSIAPEAASGSGFPPDDPYGKRPKHMQYYAGAAAAASSSKDAASSSAGAASSSTGAASTSVGAASSSAGAAASSAASAGASSSTYAAASSSVGAAASSGGAGSSKDLQSDGLKLGASEEEEVKVAVKAEGPESETASGAVERNVGDTTGAAVKSEGVGNPKKRENGDVVANGGDAALLHAEKGHAAKKQKIEQMNQTNTKKSNIDDLWAQMSAGSKVSKPQKVPSVQKSDFSSWLNTPAPPKKPFKMKRLKDLEAEAAAEIAKAKEASGSKRTGLEDILDIVRGKSERVIDKTKQQWSVFKEEKGVQNELESYKKDKGRYTDRVAFLQRTDQREWEFEQRGKKGRR